MNHDTHLAVVDRRGRVRGYFSALPDPDSDNPEKDFATELGQGSARKSTSCWSRTARRLLPAAQRFAERRRRRPAAARITPPSAGVGSGCTSPACCRRWPSRRCFWRSTSIFTSSSCTASPRASTTNGRTRRSGWRSSISPSSRRTRSWRPRRRRWRCTRPTWASLSRLARHVWIARWTLPIWLYVSVTGVVVYWMLYRLY